MRKFVLLETAGKCCPCPKKNTESEGASCYTLSAADNRLCKRPPVLRLSSNSPQPFFVPTHRSKMYAFATSAVVPRTAASSFVARCATPSRAVRPARRAAAPRMLAAETLTTLPLLPLAEMRVTFPAYLAVFLGTLIPVAFLIILFIQSESRKAGEEAGRRE